MATHLMHPTTTRARHAPFVVTETHVNAALLMIGRLIFGGYFAYAGGEHFMNRAMLAGAAAAHGVPQPDLAILGTGLLLVLGGLSILTGFVPKVGAACLAVFLIGVTPIMHAFWNDTDPV
jgi:putative oxidoreductase